MANLISEKGLKNSVPVAEIATMKWVTQNPIKGDV